MLDYERRELAIDADLGQLRDAREWAAEAARSFGLDTDDCYAVKLAMSEAVANAIQHGSESTSDCVRLTAWAEGDALMFEVLDTGTFIPPAAAPTDDDERGRGLELVSLMMDEVRLVPGEGGSLLRFAKRRA